MGAGSEILTQSKNYNLKVVEIPITVRYDSGVVAHWPKIWVDLNDNSGKKQRKKIFKYMKNIP